MVSVSAWAALEFYFKLTQGIVGLGLVAHLGLLLAFAIPLLATNRFFHPAGMWDAAQQAAREVPSRNRMRRGLVAGLSSLVLVLGTGIVYQSAVSAGDREKYAPVGNLILVDGHEMHLYCIGQGNPTVILESGVGGNLLLWGYIQPALAATTRICAYDRAGYGWSEPVRDERTVVKMAEELHGLLTQADVPAPYILAGHSFGGLVARDFTSLYPNEVVGMVLLDAAHPNQFSPERCTPGCFPSSAITLVDMMYTLLPATARIGLVRLLVPAGVLPLPFFSLPDRFPERDALVASFSANLYSDTILSEWDAFPQSAAIVKEAGDIGDLPIRVVTALNTYRAQPIPMENPETTTQRWIRLQRDLLRLSTNSSQTVVEEATHFSLLVNPNHAIFVNQVINGLVEEIR